MNFNQSELLPQLAWNGLITVLHPLLRAGHYAVRLSSDITQVSIPHKRLTESFCSLQVGEKLKLGAKTAIDIDKLRDGYRPAAKLGAVLFFVLSEMSAVNSMYQYSLASYLQVFDLSLRKSLPDSILPKRLKNIMDTLTMNVYNYACTGKGIPHDDLYDTLNP